MYVQHSVETPGYGWLVVYGALCLALRHPQFTGPARGITARFVSQLGDALVEWGVLTREQRLLVEITKVEETKH